MTEARIERRLAAVACVDVVGYSRLVGTDETGTIATWRAHREAILPLVAAHGGRLVGTQGDELLLEFASVVGAVASALAIQETMRERGVAEPPARRFQLRIGINLGDIIAEGTDILGDGVNVAARLEALADPGSICVADVVREQVQGKLPVVFDDLGLRTVKNIRQPVHAWRLRPAGSSPPAHPVMEASRPRSGRRLMTAIALTLLTVLGAAALGTRLAEVWPWAEERRLERIAIMVLPFESAAGQDQEHLSDGITEDIITALSKRAALANRQNLQVIGRSTAFSHKGQKVNVRRLARELNVTHVLVGSVRRDGSRLRISAELIDASTGRSSWAERYDHQAGAVFDIQDDVTGKVVGTLMAMLDTSKPGGSDILSRPSGKGGPHQVAEGDRAPEEQRRLEEARRQAERTRSIGPGPAPGAPAPPRPSPAPVAVAVSRPSMAIYELVLQARSLAGKDAREPLLEARALLMRAVAQEPRYAPAQLALADTWLLAYARRWTDADGAPEGLEAALRSADAALALRHDVPATQALRAVALAHLGRHAEAKSAAELARVATTLDAGALDRAAIALVLFGEPAMALEVLARARRRDPIPSPAALATQARAQFLLGRDAEAAQAAEACLSRAPAERDCLEMAAAALARQDKLDAARMALAKLRSLDRDFVPETPRTRFSKSYRNPADLDMLVAALRKAAS